MVTIHFEAARARVVHEFAQRRAEVEHVTLYTDADGRARVAMGQGLTTVRDITPMQARA